MNEIQTEIQPDDRRFVGRGKSAATLAEEVLECLKSGSPYSLTFIDLDDAMREAGASVPLEILIPLEASLKAKFERWANDCAAPRLRAIIAKQTP